MRIYKRILKRRYLGGKGFYLYQAVSLPIPRKHQELLKPYIGRDLDIDIAMDLPAEKITITLKAKPDPWQKLPSTEKTPPQKHKEIVPPQSLNDGQ